MQKKIQGFRGALPLVTLFAILATTFIGSLPSSLADPPPVTTGTSSTSCNGHNNSNMPNSNCNGNTPDPASGSCQLAWMNGGGGSTPLHTSNVTFIGLQQTLAGYNLRCAPDVRASSCTLVQGANDSGNTKLDLANVQNRSPWIYQQLNGQYSLNCDNNGTTRLPGQTGQPAQIEDFNQICPGQCFYLVSKLAPLYVDIQDSRADIGTSGTPIIDQTKNNPPTKNQVWQFVPDGANDGYGYIQSALPGVNTGNRPLVLDIQYAGSTDRTPVIAQTKNNPPTDNQLWQRMPDGVDGYNYIISKLPHAGGGSLVLDIPDANSAARTKLIVSHENNPIGQPPSPNQVWKGEDCQVQGQGTVNGKKMTEKTRKKGRKEPPLVP